MRERVQEKLFYRGDIYLSPEGQPGSRGEAEVGPELGTQGSACRACVPDQSTAATTLRIYSWTSPEQSEALICFSNSF